MKPGIYRDWTLLARKLWPSIIGAIILWTAVITGIILLAGCSGRVQDAAIGGLYGFGGAPSQANYIINGEYMSCRQIGNTTHCY